MNKEEQGSAKVQLYNLVRMFVRAYQPRYYVQYKGELDDLVSDFYLEFLTPKSREKGKEESLLDKFDPSITTLPYLVKIAVQRMLIDRSRKDKHEISLDDYMDEYGDVVLKRFNLASEETETIDDYEPTEEDLALYKKAWWLRTPYQQKVILDNLKQVENILKPSIKNFLYLVIGKQKEKEYFLTLTTGESLRVFQVTEKSIQLIHLDSHEIITYNKATGLARGKNNFIIDPQSLEDFLVEIGTLTFKLKGFRE